MTATTPRGRDAERRGSPSAKAGAAVELPSEVSGRVGLFDRFAGHASSFASRAPFFACCVGIVVLWVPSYLVFRDVDTWQLIINTTTTIITFLMVALLQNSQGDAVGLETREAS